MRSLETSPVGSCMCRGWRDKRKDQNQDPARATALCRGGFTELAMSGRKLQPGPSHSPAGGSQMLDPGLLSPSSL